MQEKGSVEHCCDYAGYLICNFHNPNKLEKTKSEA